LFTGIIEEIGHVVSCERQGDVARLLLRCDVVRADLKIGDSLAVNGVCLTVERIAEHIATTMMAETLRRTTLGALRTGDAVNLERALRLDSRLGGHLVMGHVDGIGKISRVRTEGETRVLQIVLPSPAMRLVAPQGSVAVDGVSLTVVQADEESFTVSLVRHTLSATTLSQCQAGNSVNVEVDIMARYAARLLGQSREGMTLSSLAEMGY